jgi:hypothetical protein
MLTGDFLRVPWANYNCHDRAVSLCLCCTQCIPFVSSCLSIPSILRARYILCVDHWVTRFSFSILGTYAFAQSSFLFCFAVLGASLTLPPRRSSSADAAFHSNIAIFDWLTQSVPTVARTHILFDLCALRPTRRLPSTDPILTDRSLSILVDWIAFGFHLNR